MPTQIMFPAVAPSGSPVAQPIYIVDQFGNPISSTNPQPVSQFSPPWLVNQSSNNATVAVGAANTVIKAAPGDLVTIVVTTAGTTGFTVFDNASTNSGTQLYNSKSAPALGDIYTIFGRAKNGITIANTATGPALTVFFN